MAEGGTSEIVNDSLKRSCIKAIESGSNDEELERSISSLRSNEKSMSEIFRKGGISAVSLNTYKRLTEWKSESVNIAIIGRSGVGKSTFINAVRGDVRPGSPVYAPVGHSETTLTATPYQDPDHKRIIFWDLPGAGTSTFPRRKYLTDSRINFKRYDIFIIMATERFAEDEHWLAKEIRKIGKLFLFVRTKVDAEIDSDRKINKSEADGKKVVDTIRKACQENLAIIDPAFKDLYLIGSLEIDNTLLDFDKLCVRLFQGLPGLKGEALLYSLKVIAPEILEAKLKSLLKRICGMAVFAAATGAIPIPVAGTAANGALIAKEAKFYRKQLGITKADLETVASLMNLPVIGLVEKYKLKSFVLALSEIEMSHMAALLSTESIKAATFLVLPVIGSVFGATASFLTTVKVLSGMLDIMATDARQILQLITQYTNKRVRILSDEDNGDD